VLNSPPDPKRWFNKNDPSDNDVNKETAALLNTGICQRVGTFVPSWVGHDDSKLLDYAASFVLFCFSFRRSLFLLPLVSVIVGLFPY
jgi:hypothetical protein